MNGLMAYASPIILDGQPVAHIFLGQFLHEPANQAAFVHQAREFGLDEEAYLEALQKVPIVPAERIEALLAFIVDLVQSQASKGLEHLRLVETTSEANKALRREIAVHKRSVKALHRSNTELGKSEARTALMLRSVQMAGGSLELN